MDFVEIWIHLLWCTHDNLIIGHSVVFAGAKLEMYILLAILMMPFNGGLIRGSLMAGSMGGRELKAVIKELEKWTGEWTRI